MVVIMEKTFMDRTGWGPGPWDGEPDKVQFKDTETGYDCIVRRSPLMGSWCGYVGVPEGHPCYKKGYYEVDVDVHGGLTFARECDGDIEGGVCHKTEDGKEVWWLGFDCGHWKDLSPASNARSPSLFFELKGITEYRDIDYVKNETLSLARQLKNIELGISNDEIQSTH